MNNQGIMLIAVEETGTFVVDDLDKIDALELKRAFDNFKSSLSTSKITIPRSVISSRMCEEKKFSYVKWILTGLKVEDSNNTKNKKGLIVCASRVNKVVVTEPHIGHHQGHVILHTDEIIANKSTFIFEDTKHHYFESLEKYQSWKLPKSLTRFYPSGHTDDLTATISLQEFDYYPTYAKFCDYCLGTLKKLGPNFHVCQSCNRIDRQKLSVCKKLMTPLQKEIIDEVSSGKPYHLAPSTGTGPGDKPSEAELLGLRRLFEEYGYYVYYVKETSSSRGVVYISKAKGLLPSLSLSSLTSNFPVIAGGIPDE